MRKPSNRMMIISQNILVMMYLLVGLSLTAGGDGIYEPLFIILGPLGVLVVIPKMLGFWISGFLTEYIKLIMILSIIVLPLFLYALYNKIRNSVDNRRVDIGKVMIIHYSSSMLMIMLFHVLMNTLNIAEYTKTLKHALRVAWPLGILFAMLFVVLNAYALYPIMKKNQRGQVSTFKD